MYENDMYQNDGGGPRPRGSFMGRISLYLGVLSLVLCLMFYLSIPLGALAVICALLARTDSPKSKKYRTSIICGICGIVLSLAMMVSVFYRVISDPQMRSYIEQYVQIYSGDYDWDLKEEMGDVFPFSLFLDGEEQENDGMIDGGGTEDGHDKEPGPDDQKRNPSDSQDKGGVFI